MEIDHDCIETQVPIFKSPVLANITVGVCEQCGRGYIDPETIAQLEPQIAAMQYRIDGMSWELNKRQIARKE